jgi:hypothetical protein
MGFVEKILTGSHESGGTHFGARPFLIAGAVMLFAFLVIAPKQFFQNFGFVIFIAPLWLPIMLVSFAFYRWVEFRRADFIKGQKHVLLELKLPRDTMKTPLAMETIFSNLHIGSGESNWYKKFIKGGVRPWWALEIASLGGQVRFFAWTRASFRRGFESYFYAQYPGIEIIEAEDYSRLVDPTSHDYDMFGAEYSKKDPDPIPIKLYHEYGLDRPGQKPEELIDPLSQLVEFMGSIGPKEQLWFQMVFRMTKKEKFGGEKDWKKVGQEIVEATRQSTVKKRTQIDPVTGQVRELEGFPNPTKGQMEGMFSIESNLNRPGFDVGFRAIYSAPKDVYQGSMISLMLAMLKPFSAEGGNGFKPLSLFSAKFSDYPWEDRDGHHQHKEKVDILEYYRRRAYFHTPYIGPWSILSNAELATIFHIPTSTIETPSLPRIQSATSGAPSNLPT